jgi:glycerol kinase
LPKSTVRAESLHLSIDQGGNSSRAMVFDRRGRLWASGVMPVSTQRPRSGWVEQDPLDILESVAASLRAVAEEVGERAAEIRAAGLATQRSSVVCWDRISGEALSPVISWQDRRGEDLMRGLRSRRTSALVKASTGLVFSSHYGASKIRWCLDNLPAVGRALQQGRLLCGPLASYLLFHLCEERPAVVDSAIAARTLLWDIRTLDWSPELLEIFGVPRTVLPDCVPCRHEFGRLSLGGVAVPLVVSTGDQCAALFANGRPEPHDALVNLGTGAFVQRISRSPVGAECGLLRSVVWQDSETTLRALEGSINGCGSALETVGATLGLDADTVEANLDSWLAGKASALLFLNGVSGLGSPYWVADYPTQLLGSGEPWQVMVAVLESIVFLLQINLQAAAGELGVPERIVVTGGLAASRGLCQRLADLSGVGVERSGVREATARGTAFLVAGGSDEDPADQASERFVPRDNPELRARFRTWRRELEARLRTSEEAP